MNKTCLQCNREFWNTHSGSMFCSKRCFGLSITVDLEERLISHRNIVGGCWIYNGYTDKKAGYGWVGVSARKNDAAHRIAFRIWKGPIPDGHKVLHTCDNPPCFNPDHLFSGTQIDNIADMVKKGRQSKGEERSSHKLTESQVREIRLQRARGGRVLAAEFNVHQSTIYSILSGKKWKHIL